MEEPARTRRVISMTSQSEKHGQLFGGALTDEVLGSSRRVLQKARGNKNATS